MNELPIIQKTYDLIKWYVGVAKQRDESLLPESFAPFPNPTPNFGGREQE
jgi:hypothetical protein